MCCLSEKRASSEKQDLGPRRLANIGTGSPTGRDQVAEETFGVSEVVAGGVGSAARRR